MEAGRLNVAISMSSIAQISLAHAKMKASNGRRVGMQAARAVRFLESYYRARSIAPLRFPWFYIVNPTLHCRHTKDTKNLVLWFACWGTARRALICSLFFALCSQ